MGRLPWGRKPWELVREARQDIEREQGKTEKGCAEGLEGGGRYSLRLGRPAAGLALDRGRWPAAD